MSLTQNQIMLSLKERIIAGTIGALMVAAGSYLGYKVFKGVVAQAKVDALMEHCAKIAAKQKEQDELRKNWEETEFVAS